jgi:glycosyltransferase involved in cell wall biosynthesis
MRIAQVAPLYESVPPRLYGGTERVVSYLTEELVRQGHRVTLFAAGDSTTRAELVHVVPRALRLDASSTSDVAPHLRMLERVLSRSQDFDIVHFHVDALAFPFARRMATPHVSTLHGRLDLPHLPPLFEEYAELPVVSISDAQRGPLPQARWSRTVYHGLPESACRGSHERPSYFAFLGRISPEKRVDRAIEVATRLGVPLRIAAKVDAVDRVYFEREIRPLLDSPLVEFVGEIGESEKPAFLRGAIALLFLIDWPEPFGLAMIEAMSCGTPVVAFRHGSVPEVIEEGVTGFAVDDMEQATAAAARAGELDRARCRAAFERRFSVRRMAEEYVQVYRMLIERRRHASAAHEDRVGLDADATAAE